MTSLRRPHWLLLTVTLPQAVLFATAAATWSIVNSLLETAHIEAWVLCGGILVALWSLSSLAAVFAALRGRPLPPWSGLALIAAYVPFLFLFTVNVNRILPWSIPRWMFFRGDLILSVYTLIMPALIFGLFLTVAWLTPEEKTHRAWKNFALALFIPFGWYLIMNAGRALHRHTFVDKFLPYVFVVCTVAFLFLLLRTAHILLMKKTGFLRRHRLLWLGPVSFLFPLLGLALNGGLLYDGKIPSGVFGDFSHPLFYALAALNGIALCLPDPRGDAPRTALIVARAGLLPFTVYFFIVMLPYFPLAVLAVTALGAGFLMLTPLILLPVHLRVVQDDFRWMKNRYHSGFAMVALAVALFLPAAVASGCYYDRIVLHQALDYVFEPDFSDPEGGRVDTAALGRVLKNVSANRANQRGTPFGSRTPYLSPLYQYVVLDNLTLSSRKIRMIECIFFGASDIEAPLEERIGSPAEEVKITSISAATRFLEEQDCWKSQIDLEITNTTDSRQEFATAFELPTGSWISGYHLWIEGRKEPGILAEKRTALWVYRQIVSTRRDPGILYYRQGRNVAFRVFPFAPKETRKTGFEVVHREPVQLKFGDRTVLLETGGRGKGAAGRVTGVQNGAVRYVPASVKAKLPRVRRQPYFHFVVDRSSAAAGRGEEFSRRVDRFLAKNHIGPSPTRFTLTGYRTVTFDLDGFWKRKIEDHPAQGGFFLERSLREILFRHQREGEGTFPIVVVVTDDAERAIFEGDMSDLAFAAPETPYVYLLDRKGNLVPRHFADFAPAAGAGGFSPDAMPSVLVYPDEASPVAFLPDDGRGSVVIVPEELGESAQELSPSTWERGLALEGLWRALQLDPSRGDRAWLDIVSRSFEAGIMTPATSFIALENEAQKEALLARQHQVLNARRSLDLGEEPLERMPEPPLWVLLLCVVSAMGMKSSKCAVGGSGGFSMVRAKRPGG